MSGQQEYGKCEVCGEMGNLIRTYFRYPINCECHSPEHFELRCHHKECVAIEPIYTKVEFKTEDLKNPIPMAMKILTKSLKEDKTEGGYYHSWQSNITCEIMDNSDLDHDKANEIAVKFLNRLIAD